MEILSGNANLVFSHIMIPILSVGECGSCQQWVQFIWRDEAAWWWALINKVFFIYYLSKHCYTLQTDHSHLNISSEKYVCLIYIYFFDIYLVFWITLLFVSLTAVYQFALGSFSGGGNKSYIAFLSTARNCENPLRRFGIWEVIYLSLFI